MGSDQKRRLENILIPLSMVLVQIFTMGMLLLSKAALSQGMFIFALLGYRNAIGVVFVAPFAFLFERELRQKLSWSAILWIFINALLGISMAMGMYYFGLQDTSASYSANVLNLIPIVTFILAVIIRAERLQLNSRGGKVKTLGTLLSVGGAMLVSLYRGKALHIWPSHLHKHHHLLKEARGHNWLRGTLLLMGSCLSYAFWFNAQVKLFKVFPSKYWATMLTCVAGCFQTISIGLIIDREKAAWRLKWDLQTLTIVYSGILNTGATFCLISWAIMKRGPTYPSMFNSLSVIFTLILESFLMGQDITVGSLIGTLLITGGLYAFLWGKKEESCQDTKKIGDNHGYAGNMIISFLPKVKLFKVFPSKYWATMLTCVAGCFQTVTIGLIIDREKAAWRLKWDLQTLTIVYSGILNTGATFCLISWAIMKRGPTYPSMFNSLSVIFTLILESLLMGQDITVGSLIGTLLITGGLYAFLWGKKEELCQDTKKIGDSKLAPDESIL